MTMNRDTKTASQPAVPWWRVRMVWLVIGGPLAVVVASFATLGLALRHPDPVLVVDTGTDDSNTPAVTARNHAAQPRR